MPMIKMTILFMLSLTPTFGFNCLVLDSISSAPVLDTLMDVGGHKLHFNVRRGKSPAIIFENGGGDNLLVWDGIMAAVYRNTGATLITYDRAGCGTSELDSSKISLTQQVRSLENGLNQLGIKGYYVLVAHSLGGYFATIFAARNDKKVKGVVMVDANYVAFWTDKQTRDYWAQYEGLRQKFKVENPGVYWLMQNAQHNAVEMRAISFPATVPVIDILAENPPWESADALQRWREAHENFVRAAPNRTMVEAKKSGHYIMNDRPELVVDAISQIYKASINSK